MSNIETLTQPEPVKGPGKRALRTRTRLLEATVALLDGTPIQHISVVDVARQAQVSPATFYQYFDSLDAAVLALLEDLVSEAVEQPDKVRETVLSYGDVLPGAITRAFMNFVVANRAALAAAVACTVQGDKEFATWLDNILRPTVDTLTACVMKSKKNGFSEESVRTELAIEVRSALLTALMHERRTGEDQIRRWEIQVFRMKELVESLKAADAS